MSYYVYELNDNYVRADFADLVGKVLKSVEIRDDNETIVFETIDGEIYFQYYPLDYIGEVYVDDVVGDFNDIIGTPILVAEESNSNDDGKGDAYYTWTFYRLATVKGWMNIKWYGTSHNGYYSECAEFYKVKVI